MLSTPDAALARRDPAVPGLATLLDPEAFLAELRSAVPEAPLETVDITYVRYKPGTDCLVRYRLGLDGGSVDGYAKAVRRDMAEKVRRSRPRFVGAGPLGSGHIILEHLALAVLAFPNDHGLKALPSLADADSRRSLVRHIVPHRPDLWDAALRNLAYKPERRYVAALVAEGSARAVLKAYTESSYQAAKHCAQAFRPGGRLATPKVLGSSDRRRILVLGWEPGCPLSDALSSPRLALASAAATGAALAELHAQDPQGLAYPTREEEAARTLTLGLEVGSLCPHLAHRADDLAHRAAGLLLREPAVCAPIHGDFHPGQVLIAGDQAVLLDFDRAARGDPAADLGTFAAYLERDATVGKLSQTDAELFTDAVQAEYAHATKRPISAAVPLYTAVGLLRLAVEPFRYREPDWPAKTEALLERADAILTPVRKGAPGGLG